MNETKIEKITIVTLPQQDRKLFKNLSAYRGKIYQFFALKKSRSPVLLFLLTLENN